MSSRSDLLVLPTRTDSAAANMAADFMLLRRYPAEGRGHARFRNYGWFRPSWSFGYGQKIARVREWLPAEAEGADLVRRPTGGGLVDHREDWTYALVLPRGHALESARAQESYRAVHLAVAAALNLHGQAAVLNERRESGCTTDGLDPRENEAASIHGAAKGPTVCFTRPECSDVMDPLSGKKIAGGAQKRTKEGLLFQGSIWCPAAGAVGDWEAFRETFVAELARALGANAEETGWPDYPEGEHDGLTEHYAAQDWTEAR